MSSVTGLPVQTLRLLATYGFSVEGNASERTAVLLYDGKPIAVNVKLDHFDTSDEVLALAKGLLDIRRNAAL